MSAGLMEAEPASATAFLADPDPVRMQRDRMDRIRGQMGEAGLDALVLLANNNVAYATGLAWPLPDAGRATFERPVAVVLADDPDPHLFSPMRGSDEPETAIPPDHLHGATYLDFDEGVEQFAAAVGDMLPAGATIALDEWTHAMSRETSVLLASDRPADAGRIISAAKLVKTPDELAFMRQGLAISETAVRAVQERLEPGMQQTDLTAIFLAALFDAGADANVMDPMWQVMPARMADGPWTTTGDLAVPLLTTERKLEWGDVLWSDVSTSYRGFHTDFGRTWIVGQEPNDTQRAQFAHWMQIMDAVLGATRAGATCADLTSAAVEAYGGAKPWLPHFYLGHGLGIDSAEMPFVGSDIGPAFDESFVLTSGMVLVLEPVVWEEGAAGYRAEEVLVITDDGWIPMTDYTYDPF
jgi:Xaa-Pro dipeptidase